MPSKAIPPEVKQQVQQIVEHFNENEIADLGISYCVRFRGNYVYLDVEEGLGPGPVSRLAYTGDMAEWEFAIYKYSTERYDPDEFWFPGADELDGTIEGALRAGIEAYG